MFLNGFVCVLEEKYSMDDYFFTLLFVEYLPSLRYLLSTHSLILNYRDTYGDNKRYVSYPPDPDS